MTDLKMSHRKSPYCKAPDEDVQFTPRNPFHCKIKSRGSEAQRLWCQLYVYAFDDAYHTAILRDLLRLVASAPSRRSIDREYLNKDFVSKDLCPTHYCALRCRFTQ
jgi:hypothetical protein